jgi:hypothetical protein
MMRDTSKLPAPGPDITPIVVNVLVGLGLLLITVAVISGMSS